jgi:hypothetical protein
MVTAEPTPPSMHPTTNRRPTSPPSPPPARQPTGTTRDITPPALEPVVTVEQQPMDDPDDDRAAQMGDADGEFLIDVYDGGVIAEVLDAIIPGCLGTC